MRIGVDIRELQRGRRTGIGRILETVITQAALTHPDLHWFLYGNSNTRTFQPAERTVVRVLSQPATLWFDQVSLPRALARDQVDVFWSPYYKAPWFSPCPIVVTIHDVVFLRVGSRDLRDALFKPWARLMGSRATTVLTDSEHSRRDLEQLLGLRPSRIVVTPLGVSPGFSPAAGERAAEVLKRLGLPETYILTVTNFQPHKNDQLLVEAFADLAPTHPDLALVLAGRPARSVRPLVQAIESLGLDRRVFLPGLIPEEDLPALYAGARVFAFPSIYEGFGLPVLEAMASGVPVACSSSSSLAELAAGAALLLEPHDLGAWQRGLERLLSEAPLRRQLAEAGLERAKKFLWATTVESILSVLEEAA